MRIAAVSAGPACSGPGEEATRTGEACVESDLIAQCPPGSNPLLGASAESMCQVDGEVDLVENSGSVSGRCYGAGTCHVACRFATPCPCGVDSVTRDGVYCTDCANASACGNGVCEGGETDLACPEDCAGDCTPGQERCQGTDRESCDGTGHWMRLACLEGETCEDSGGGSTLCLRNDVQRGGETGEPEPRQDRVDGRVWFGEGELPPGGTGTALATPPVPNRGYVLENLAIITLEPNTGARGKDLARAGFGPLRNGELALDWKTRVHPADVDEGDYLVLYGPKRVARYSLQMGPPPQGVAETEATYPPDMAGDEGNPDVGLTFQAAFSADWKTVVWARNFYDFDGVGDPAFLPDAELSRFDARTATNVALARTGIYRLARTPLALTPDGRFAAAAVTLAGGPPAVLTYDAEHRGRPLVLSRVGEGGYPASVLGVSPNGGLLATQGAGLNPAPGTGWPSGTARLRSRPWRSGT